MFELNLSEKMTNESVFELNIVEKRTNEPIQELNFSEKLRFGLNIDKTYSEIG